MSEARWLTAAVLLDGLWLSCPRRVQEEIQEVGIIQLSKSKAESELASLFLCIQHRGQVLHYNILLCMVVYYG